MSKAEAELDAKPAPLLFVGRLGVALVEEEVLVPLVVVDDVVLLDTVPGDVE